MEELKSFIDSTCINGANHFWTPGMDPYTTPINSLDKPFPVKQQKKRCKILDIDREYMLLYRWWDFQIVLYLMGMKLYIQKQWSDKRSTQVFLQHWRLTILVAWCCEMGWFRLGGAIKNTLQIVSISNTWEIRGEIHPIYAIHNQISWVVAGGRSATLLIQSFFTSPQVASRICRGHVCRRWGNVEPTSKPLVRSADSTPRMSSKVWWEGGSNNNTNTYTARSMTRWWQLTWLKIGEMIHFD